MLCNCSIHKTLVLLRQDIVILTRKASGLQSPDATKHLFNLLHLLGIPSHLSTSGMITSRLAKIATKSAIFQPLTISGRAAKFEKEAVRSFTL